MNEGQNRIVIILIDGESVLGRVVSNLGVMAKNNLQSNIVNLPDNAESAKVYLNKLAAGLVKRPPSPDGGKDTRIKRSA